MTLSGTVLKGQAAYDYVMKGRTDEDVLRHYQNIGSAQQMGCSMKDARWAEVLASVEFFRKLIVHFEETWIPEGERTCPIRDADNEDGRNEHG